MEMEMEMEMDIRVLDGGGRERAADHQGFI
jgi:hypothetical protein